LGKTPCEIWRQIGDIAAQSPSTHNTQAWRVRVESDRAAALFYERERTLPAEDINGDFNMINMGIFTRGLEIGAATHGRRLTWSYALDESEHGASYVPVARLALDAGDDQNSASLLTPFLLRRTSRLPYDGRRVDSQALGDQKALARERGHRFGCTQDPRSVRWVMEFNAETIAYDLQVPAIRQELRRWIRFTRREAENKADGLWTACLNENSGLAWYLTRAPQLLLLPFARRILRDSYLAAQAGTPAIGWISGDTGTREKQVEAGRFLLDFWVRLTAWGLYILPYGSLYTNSQSNREVGLRTGDPDFWMIFRMGYGRVPPKSFRLPVQRLLM
jgi:nitroreductase